MANQPLTTYHGNCHCGAFEFSVKLPQLRQAVACNCSICSKKGYLWAFPSSDHFVVEKGDGALKGYEFGNKSMVHKFCPNCGTAVMATRETSIGLNVRTLSDFDEEKVEFKPYNGAAAEPHYTPPNTSDLTQTPKLYRGSCHCGKVTFDLHSNPLEEAHIASCNCSICSRIGALWLYPAKTAVELHFDGNDLATYQFATKAAKHSFCSTCGVYVANRFEQPEGRVVESMLGKLPVNVRAVNGIELDALKVSKVDGKKI